jgi:hypothetical protein
VAIVEAREGKDAYDHLGAGHGLDAFVFVDVQPKSQRLERPRIEVVTAKDLVSRPDPRRAAELLGPLLIRGERLVIGGHTGHGKTTFAFRMLAAAIGGREFLGFTGAGSLRALIIDAEQSERSIKRKLLDADLGRSDVEVLPIQAGLSLNDPADAGALDEVFAAGAYDIVLIDPLYKLHTGEANDERAMTDLMRQLDAWRQIHGFALVLPAHLRKPVQRGKPTIHDVSGHSATTWSAETVIGIEKTGHGRARLHFWKSRDGDFAIGASWNLIFDDIEGFLRAPEDERPKQRAVDKIREALVTQPGLTYKELQAATGLGDKSVRDAVTQLGCDKNGTPVRCSLPVLADAAAR